MALINNIDELREFLTIPNNLSFDALKPSCSFAESNFALKILGDNLYTQLNDAVAADNLNADELKLIAEVRKVIAYMAYAKYIVMGNAKVSDLGITAVHTTNEKPAFEWQVKQMAEEAQEMAYKAIDNLFLYLESVKETFSDWMSAAAYTDFKELFVPTAIDFSKCWSINNSRLTYLALVPKIRFVETFFLDSLLGATYVAELRAEFIAGSLTAPNSKIVELLKHYIVRKTIEAGLDGLSVEVSVFGMVRNYATNTINSSRPADADERAKLIKNAADEAEMYKLEILKVIYADIGNYATFKAGVCYIDPAVDDDVTDRKMKQYNSFLRT